MVEVVKGNVYKVVIEAIVGNNEGLAHIDGFPVYVKGVSKGNVGKTFKVEVLSVKKYHCTARKV